jgi:Fe-S cluster assembly protein SufD
MNIAAARNKAEEALANAFAHSEAHLPGSAAVKDARKTAIATFAALGLPHRRIEAWKYTDLRAHLKTIAPPAEGAPGRVAQDDLAKALAGLAAIDAHRIVFVDGCHDAALSSAGAIKGVNIKPLAAALAEAPEKVAVALTGTTGPENDATIALNTAFMTDGVVLRVADGAKLEKPLLIVFLASGADARLTSVRDIISVGAKANVTILEAHVAVPGAPASGQTNALSEVAVGEGARCDHVKITHGAGGNVHLGNCNVTLAGGASYRSFQFTAGQGLARNQISAIYSGEGAKLDLSGAYLARGNEHVDTTLVVDHAVPHCESRELFKGVMDERGRGVFQGKIIVRPDAQKSDGKQMSHALMLSPDAEFDSKPELEIYADDVVCGHGTTSAELDEDLLFYCMSRGIPENEARALLIESFIGEALDKVENESVRDALSAMASAWLKRVPVA